MKASKKLMSLLLVVAMLVCAIPFQVFADEVDPDTTPVTVPVKVAIEGGKTYNKSITVSADSAVVLRFVVNVDEKDIYSGARVLNHDLLLGFRHLGVECPFPQVDVHTD